MKMFIKIVIALVVALIIYFGYTFLKKDDTTVKFDDKTVEGIKFSDFSYEYSDKLSKIKVNIENITDTKIDIKNVIIQFYATDNNLVASSTTTLNSSLEAKGLTNIYAEVYIDMADVGYIDYSYTK